MKKPEAMDHPALEKESIPIETPDILAEEEIRQLIGAATTPRDKAIITVLHEGGMRIGELAEFPKGSPALKTGPRYMAFGDVKKVPHGYKIHVRHTKDREERWVPIYYYAADLKQWLTLHPTQQDQDPLWCYQQGGKLYPLKYGAMKRIIQQAAKRAGIKKRVHPHLLRKQWASEMKEKRNMDSWDIAQMGGWVPNSRQMRRYIRQNPNAVHERYAKSLGIREMKEEPSEPDVRKECLNCREPLSPTSIYCPHCGQIQNKETVELHKEAIKDNRRIAEQYREEMDLMKQELVKQQQKFKELEELFNAEELIQEQKLSQRLSRENIEWSKAVIAKVGEKATLEEIWQALGLLEIHMDSGEEDLQDTVLYRLVLRAVKHHMIMIEESEKDKP